MQILIIRGERRGAAQWAADLGALYAPTRMIFAIPRRCRAAARAGRETRRGRHRGLFVHRHDLLGAAGESWRDFPRA